MTVDGKTFKVFYDIYLEGGNGFGKSRSILNIAVTPWRNVQYGTSFANPTMFSLFKSYKDRNNYSRLSTDQYIGSLPKDSHLVSKRFSRFTKN